MESRISADLLSRYRRIAEARKGIALAEAKDELCSACHVRIRPQMYANLHPYRQHPRLRQLLPHIVFSGKRLILSECGSLLPL